MTFPALVLSLLVLACAACGVRGPAEGPACLGPLPAAGAAPTASSADDAALGPAEYLRLHDALDQTAAPAWPATLQRLGAMGDGFTLERLAALDRSRLDAAARGALDAATATLSARLPPDSPDALAAALEARFERAAMADLVCDPLESTLVPWVRRGAAAGASAPRVRAELERLASAYVAPEAGELGSIVSSWYTVAPETFAPMLQARVRDYARRALDPASTGFGPTLR
jgi:hypothetical protein